MLSKTKKWMRGTKSKYFTTFTGHTEKYERLFEFCDKAKFIERSSKSEPLLRSDWIIIRYLFMVTKAFRKGSSQALNLQGKS